MATSSSENMINGYLVAHWNAMHRKPDLIVFDLDYTLWPLHVDIDIELPLRKEANVVVDANGNEIEPFEDIEEILTTLKEKCLTEHQHLAVASKAQRADKAMALLEQLGWTKFFSSFQVYSEPKPKHLSVLKDEFKLKHFNQILFFDDHPINIKQVAAIGVVSHKIDRNIGLNVNEFQRGLDRFNRFYS